MSVSLLPKIMADSLLDLSADFLKLHGIRLLMLDFDNTIVPYTTDIPTEQMLQWLETMKASDITVCVVSNSRNDRVKIFCEKHGIPCVTHAAKPRRRGILQCMEQYGVPASQAALVGDQIFTDTLGANRAGITSILIRAIDNHNFWLKLRHVAEKPFIFIARKRRIRL